MQRTESQSMVNEPRKRKRGASPVASTSRFGREADIERLHGINRRTLQKWRLFGKGPKFYRAGRIVLYDLAEVEQFIRSGAVGGE